MTPADRGGMLRDWRDWHAHLDDDLHPAVNASFERGFAAGLAYAREQAAAQLEARASEIDHQYIKSCMLAAQVLREQAEKIRRGE